MKKLHRLLDVIKNLLLLVNLLESMDTLQFVMSILVWFGDIQIIYVINQNQFSSLLMENIFKQCMPKVLCPRFINTIG